MKLKMGGWPFILLTLVLIQDSKAQFQFHQEDSDIIHDKIDLYKYNKAYLQDAYARAFKYNDTLTMKAVSFGAFFLKDIKNNFHMQFVAQKLVGKRYRTLPFNFTAEMCEEYRKLGQQNPFGIKTAIEISNFRGCPFLKQQHYHLNDWIVEQDKFPPHIPAGKYALAVKGWVEGKVWLFEAAWFGEIAPKKSKK